MKRLGPLIVVPGWGFGDTLKHVKGSIPTMIFIVVLRWVEGLGLLSHLKLLTRLPDNHASLKRQLTLNALQSKVSCVLPDFGELRT